MKKPNIFFIIGICMVAFALAFTVYAFIYPEASVNWPNILSYVIYMVYFLITVAMFVLSILYTGSLKGKKERK